MSWILVRKLICSFLAFLMAYMPAAFAYADEAPDPVADAKSLGSTLNSSMAMPTYDPNTKEFNLYPGAGDDAVPGDGSTIGVNGLFQTESADPSSYTSTYDDEAGALNLGGEAQSNLLDSTQPEGNAYKAVLSTAQTRTPSLASDPIWSQTADSINNAELVTEFSGCTTSSTVEASSSSTVHIPDYRTCERVVEPRMACEVEHNYEVNFLRHISGPTNIQSCGSGCVEMWIGRVGDNYLSGWCTIIEQALVVDLSNTDAVISATLEYAKWDDYMQVVINDNLVWQGHTDFPPETPGQCELSTSWERSLSTDITSYFSTDGRKEFKVRASVSGNGEAYGRIKIRYDPSKVVDGDVWYPQDCIDKAIAAQAGGCATAIQCVAGPEYSGCSMVDGELICEDFLAASPFSGINPFCTQVSVNSICLQTQGSLECYTDAHGVVQCPTTNGDIESNCEPLEENPNCAFVESNCVDGAFAGGACRVYDDVYDCGYDTTVQDYDISSTISCGADIQCMGTDCMDPADSESNSFNQVAASMQIAKMMQNDGDCSDTVFADCQVFKGEALECKKAVGGIQDCCFNADGVSFLDYIKLISATYKLDNVIMELAPDSAVQGAWSQLREPVVDSWSAVKNVWSGGGESVMANTPSSGFDLGISDAMSTFKNQAMSYANDFVVEAFGQEAAGALFQESAAGVVQFNPALASIMGTIMLIYAIYQIAVLIIQLVFPCVEEEYELSAKRAIKACHYIGSYCRTKLLSGVCIEKRTSYCCFNSPLSRIIGEQTRLQGIGSWGSPRTPNCSGLTVAQLDRVDWDRVDLSEWIGMLNVAGALPDPTQYSIERLTGEGSTFDFDDENPRSNIVERTDERMDGLDYQDIVDDATDGAGTAVPNVDIPE